MAGGRKPKHLAWRTPEALDIIKAWRRRGLTMEEVAHNIGINPDTLYTWRRQFPEMAEALKEGSDEALAIVENALFQSAIGYEVKETTKEMTQGGKPKIKEVTRHIQPSVAAMIFYLKNRGNGAWKDNPTDDSATTAVINKLDEVLNNMGGNI